MNRLSAKEYPKILTSLFGWRFVLGTGHTRGDSFTYSRTHGCLRHRRGGSQSSQRDAVVMRVRAGFQRSLIFLPFDLNGQGGSAGRGEAFHDARERKRRRIPPRSEKDPRMHQKRVPRQNFPPRTTRSRPYPQRSFAESCSRLIHGQVGGSTVEQTTVLLCVRFDLVSKFAILRVYEPVGFSQQGRNHHGRFQRHREVHGDCLCPARNPPCACGTHSRITVQGGAGDSGVP